MRRVFLSTVCFAVFWGRSVVAPSTTPAPHLANIGNGKLAWQTTGTSDIIPGLLSLDCTGAKWPDPDKPCTAACASSDVSCGQAVSSAASACSPQWAAYLDASASWAAINLPGTTTVTLIQTESQTYVSYPTVSVDSTEVFSAYGGTFQATYVFGEPSTSTNWTTYNATLTYANSARETISELWQTFSISYSLYTTYTPNYIVITSGYTHQTPYCSITAINPVNCGDCYIGGGSVKLFYWPVATTKGTIGTANTNSITKTALISGVTMVSPTVYVSFQTLTAVDACGLVGGGYTGYILPMDPKSVSTIYGVSGAGYLPAGAKQLAFANLQGVVPASAYEEQYSCARYGCSTIFADDYKPTLAIPPQIRSLDTAWAGCALDLEGVYDPPVALTEESAAATPSGPFEQVAPSPSTTPAVPSSTPTHSLARSTTPVPVALPAAPTPANDPTEAGASEEPAADSQNPQDAPSDTPTDPDSSTSSLKIGGIIASVLGSTSRPSSAGAAPETSKDQPDNIGASSSKIAEALDDTTPASTSYGAQAQDTVDTGPASIVVGGSTIAPDSAGQYSIAPGASLAPGSAVTVAGTTYSLAPSASYIVVNGATSSLPDPASVLPSPAVTPSTMSLGPPGSYIVIDGITQIIAFSTPSSALAVLTFGSAAFTQGSSSNFVIDGQTLDPGSAITVSGSTISLAPSNLFAVINGVTEQIGSQTAPAVAVVTVGSVVLTVDPVNSGSAFTVDGQTLQPGSVLTISGKTISLPSASPPVLLTIGSSTILENSASAFVIDGQTLLPGSLVTIYSGADATTLSLFTTDGFTEVAFGTTSTQTLGAQTAAPTSSPLGPGGGMSSPSQSATTTSAAAPKSLMFWTAASILIIALMILRP